MNVETARMLHSALDAGANGFSHQEDVRQALTAVVRLHQPTPDGMCRACMADAIRPEYPCRTVQAIATGMGIQVTDGARVGSINRGVGR